MKKTLILSLITLIGLHAGVDMPKDDLNEPQVKHVKKFYKKFLQKSCGLTAANFAQMHTQNEWGTMQKKKIFVEEVINICPKATDTIARILSKEHGKDNFNHLLRFSIQYAKNTGKFPPC